MCACGSDDAICATIAIRASTAMAPSSSMISGLISILRIHGSSQAISETRRSTVSSALRSIAGICRKGLSRRATRERSTRSSIRRWLSGGSAIDFSLNTSATCPPSPKVITGPNSGSLCRPIDSSRPRGRETKGSIEMPSTRAAGARRLMSAMMSL